MAGHRHDPRSGDMYEPTTYALKRRIVELEEKVVELEQCLKDYVDREVHMHKANYH